MGELRFGVVTVWGVVAVYGSCGVGELQCSGVAVWGSVIVGETHYVGVTVVTKPEFLAF